jgi:hypothetical protein
MSKPFAALLKERIAGDHRRLTDEAFARITRWSSLSSDKHVTLDEVAWVAGVVMAACKNMPNAPRLKTDVVSTKKPAKDGESNVINIVATDQTVAKDRAG